MRIAARVHWPTPWELLQLAAAASFTPLRVWADNLVETQFPRGLLIWALLMWLIGVVVWLVWVAVGGQRRSVTIALFWLLLAMGSVGSMFKDDPLRVLLFLGAIAIVVGLAYRLADVRVFHVFTIWAVFIALILPLVGAVTEWGSIEESDIHDPAPVITGEFGFHPDVVVLVSDAHGSFSVLTDIYNFDVGPALDRLDASGLRLNPDMKANYSLTYLSLSSFFEMGYLVEDGESVNQGGQAVLLAAVGGQNQLVTRLKSEGYRFVMIESGWAGGRCAAEVDVCVTAPWPDEATTYAIGRSVFGIGRGPFMDSHTAGTMASLRWLEKELPTYLANGRPDFVFAHLITPHPPMRLGPDCTYRWNPGLGGRTVGVPDVDSGTLGRRKAAYIDQVECAQSAMAKVASMMGDDAIFLTFGDHGPDSRAQLFKDPPDWSQADVDERMRVFFASKAGTCSFEDVDSLVNVGPELLGCLSNSPPVVVDDRYFVATGVEGPANKSLPILEVQVTGE